MGYSVSKAERTSHSEGAATILGAKWTCEGPMELKVETETPLGVGEGRQGAESQFEVPAPGGATRCHVAPSPHPIVVRKGPVLWCDLGTSPRATAVPQIATCAQGCDFFCPC